MRSLRRTSILLATTAGTLIAATGAAYALAQGPGYKAGPLIGTIYPRTGPKTPRPTPTPPAPPSHMGGMPGHMGGYPHGGGHGSAWHIGGMGHGWGMPHPGGQPPQHGGSWHVGMGSPSHGGGHVGWPGGPRPMPGNGWSHPSGWGGGHVGWGGRPPLGVHPLGIHFYGMGGGSLAHSYGSGGVHFAGSEHWRSTYRFGSGEDLAARYGHLDHGFSPVLPPSNWGHGPLKPQSPHDVGTYAPRPVAWHPPTRGGSYGRESWRVHESWHFHGAWEARNGWRPQTGWGSHGTRHAWTQRSPGSWQGGGTSASGSSSWHAPAPTGSQGTYAWHHRSRHHGVFAWLRRDLARHGGRVVVTWTRFVYHPGGKGQASHQMHASNGHGSFGHGYAWSRPSHASSGHWPHAGSGTRTASW